MTQKTNKHSQILSLVALFLLPLKTCKHISTITWGAFSSNEGSHEPMQVSSQALIAVVVPPKRHLEQ